MTEHENSMSSLLGSFQCHLLQMPGPLSGFSIMKYKVISEPMHTEEKNGTHLYMNIYLVLPQLSFGLDPTSSVHPALRLQAELYLEQLAQGGFGLAAAKLMAHVLFGRGMENRIHMSSTISRD